MSINIDYSGSKKLSQDMNEDIFKTLFGMSVTELAQSDRFFGPAVELVMAFVSPEAPDTMWPLFLRIPFGRITATKLEYEALERRVGDKLGEVTGVKGIRPATDEEIETFQERKRQQLLLDQFSQMPPETMGQA